MKILCVSDQIDPLIYTETIKQSHADVDIVLSAGDLPMDYLDFITTNLNKPLFSVLGNHDAENHLIKAARVDAKIRYVAGLILVGLGGSMQRGTSLSEPGAASRHNKKENQFTFTNLEMNIRVLKLLPALFFNRIFRGRFLDLLLTHAPPMGIHDKGDTYYLGFKCFLWFMRVFKPRYLVHGHIHLYDLSEHRITKYHKTLVINAYGHYLLDTKKIHES